MSDTARVQEASQAVDLDAINACLARLPTAALLGELNAILAAIDSSVPSRQRRRSGFLGRLLARDLVAQARPDDVGTRVRLHLAAAHDIAGRLDEQVAQLEPLAPRLREQAQGLRSRMPETPRVDDPARRAAIAATWDVAAAHVDLVREHAMQVLGRHAQVRDVLVPAWRQQTALAARSGASSTMRLDETLSAQIAAFRAAPPSPVPSIDPSHDPALATRDASSQEPSP